jgi:hypothetical protein
MTMYCNCETCKQIPIKPHGSPGPMEQIEGLFVMMEPGWTLAHWGPPNIQRLYSKEIHLFVHLGKKPMVGASFYLFKGEAPNVPPKEFSMLGIGGVCRYTIDWDLGNQINAFYKHSIPRGDHPEVAVALGCGGYITFNGREGVSYYYTGTPPLMER